MQKTILFFAVSALILFASACDAPSPEQEIDEICTCIQEAETDADIEKCRSMMNAISDKYSFDPEAAETIKKRLRECASQ
jgi:hypothetical protein